MGNKLKVKVSVAETISQVKSLNKHTFVRLGNLSSLFCFIYNVIKVMLIMIDKMPTKMPQMARREVLILLVIFLRKNPVIHIIAINPNRIQKVPRKIPRLEFIKAKTNAKIPIKSPAFDKFEYNGVFGTLLCCFDSGLES